MKIEGSEKEENPPLSTFPGFRTICGDGIRYWPFGKVAFSSASATGLMFDPFVPIAVPPSSPV